MKFFSPDQYQKLNEVLLHQYQSKIRKLTPKARIEHMGASTLRTLKLCMLESTYDNNVAIQVVANGSEFKLLLMVQNLNIF